MDDTSPYPPPSGPAEEHERLLRALHWLSAAGHGESDAADAVRDLMDGPWHQMSREEIAAANALSARCYEEPITCSGT
jgi:hypothetical protein